MSILRRYLSDAQRADLDLHNAFNVTTPTFQIWRVLWREPGKVNLIDPKGKGRTVFVYNNCMSKDTNALAMLLALQSPKRTSYYNYYSGYTGEEFIDQIACKSCPPRKYKLPFDPEVRALYEPTAPVSQ